MPAREFDELMHGICASKLLNLASSADGRDNTNLFLGASRDHLKTYLGLEQNNMRFTGGVIDDRESINITYCAITFDLPLRITPTCSFVMSMTTTLMTIRSPQNLLPPARVMMTWPASITILIHRQIV